MRHAAMFLRQSCPLANGDALRCMHAPRRLGWASLSATDTPAGRSPHRADRDARRTQPEAGYPLSCSHAGNETTTVQSVSPPPPVRTAVCPGRSEIRLSLAGWAHHL